MSSTVGKYGILRKLAEGGMAEILLARAVTDDSSSLPDAPLRVVKRVLPQLRSERAVITMFLDEARIAATLDHPNIVRVLEAGSNGGNHFLVMEYLHGVDVAMLMRNLRKEGKRLPLALALYIVTELLAGLQYAHQKCSERGEPLGIVHRDISPHNIFVTFSGEVKVLDFGVAKAEERYSATRSGALKGKIPYMSPEQCRSERVDRRSDVFAAAIVLWEISTSQRLFRRNNDLETLRAIVDEPATPPLTVDPSYPAMLDRIVMRGLARDVDQRFSSASEMREALLAFASQAGLSATRQELADFLATHLPSELEAGRADLITQRTGSLEVVENESHTQPMKPAPRRLATPAPSSVPSAPAAASGTIRTRALLVAIALGVCGIALWGWLRTRDQAPTQSATNGLSPRPSERPTALAAPVVPVDIVRAPAPNVTPSPPSPSPSPSLSLSRTSSSRATHASKALSLSPARVASPVAPSPSASPSPSPRAPSRHELDAPELPE